jgi:uncharacterized membrane protein YfcA
VSLEPLDALALLLAGGAGGFLNAVAGGGSSVTLPVLEWTLASPGLANATNRLAVLAQNVAAVGAFQTGRRVPWRLALALSAPTALGAACGAWIAARLPDASMRVALALGVLFAAAAALLPQPRAPRLAPPWREAAFFLSGAYAGFLQIGVGFVLLACLAGGLGLDLVRANAAKVFVVLVAMVPAVALFEAAGRIVWAHGIVLALGNMGGAWIAARLAIRRGDRFVRRAVVVAALLAAVKLLLFPSGA